MKYPNNLCHEFIFANVTRDDQRQDLPGCKATRREPCIYRTSADIRVRREDLGQVGAVKHK